MKFEELQKIEPGAAPEKLNEIFNKNIEALNFFLPAIAAEINSLSKELKTKEDKTVSAPNSRPPREAEEDTGDHVVVEN